ncbi:TonB-dependent receptor [Thalassotalea insulae]|uniref:TonB-dependent receptor n=1 Tax=Thalassotalea insulae TaxID=2056778 RepID=A0ABQ6GVU8_9GAMM|nr:TonB-dependent receptor [Thalassotalea insulae]GLX78767.1 TonB-dependent receptor [Thalassotalea insulae]
MTKKFLSLSISATLFPLFSATCVLANDSGEPEANIERLTVTANRQENLDTELAMSVHSVSEQEMALDNGQHPADSLNSLAGVYIDQLAGGQGHKAAIRMPNNTSGYYLYLQDNIPLQSPAFFNHNALWWSSFNAGVQRMEVLKGAGTALYGSGAVAATINVLSKPVADKKESEFNLVAGQHDYRKLQFSHSNMLDQQSGFRVSASLFDNQGWRDHTAGTRGELSLRHEYQLASDEQLTSLLVMSDLEQEMAADLSESQWQSDRNGSGLSDEVLAVDPLRKTQYLRLSTQWEKFTANALYSVIPYLRYRTNDYTATWNTNTPKIESSVTSLGLLAMSNFTLTDKAETTIGLDIELSEGEQLSYQPLDVTTTGWGADTFVKGEKFYDDTTRYTGISPYLQYKYQATDELQLTLGGRYDYANYDFDNHITVFGDIGHGKLSMADRQDSFNHFSPKASVNYLLSPDSSLFVRYANGFRLPSAGSLYHITTKDSEEGISSLKPEVSDTYELGYKLNSDSITFDAAVYYMDVDDGIVHSYNQDGQRYLVNATRVIHKGLELATNWQLNEQLNATVAYTRSKHKFDDYQDYSGNEMMSAPETITNIRLRYHPSWLPQLTSMVEIQSVGQYWMDDANTTKADGYRVVNFKGHYQVNKQLSINARVINLTDKEYESSARISYGKMQFSPAAARTVYLGVHYQW